MQALDCAGSRGIDVSHNNGVINWQRVKAAGITFAYVKASQGVSFVDPLFLQNVRDARDAGIYVGAYHFAEGDGDAEAAHFASVIADVTLDIPPVYDIERPNADVVGNARAFLSAVERSTGVRPIVYTYPSFIDEQIGDTLSDYPLWLASYSADTPDDRGGWTSWTFLQHSESGRVDGIDGHVDLDVYEGDMEAMFNDIKDRLAALESANQTLQARVTTLEARLADVAMPDWFATEFGVSVLDGLVDTQTGDNDFWRMLAVSLRMKKNAQ